MKILKLFERARTQPKWTAIIRPFSSNVWIVFVGSFIALTIIVCFLLAQTKNISFISAANIIPTFILPIMVNQDVTQTKTRKTFMYGR